jgi:integrase
MRRGTAERLTPRHLASGRIVTATKRGRTLVLPITPRLQALAKLARASDDDADLRFIDLLNNRRVIQGSQTMLERWRRWKKQVGLPTNLRPHDLRRDFAHRAYAACHDVREVQGALGHESPITTLRYLHIAAPQMAESTVHNSLIEEQPWDTPYQFPAPTGADAAPAPKRQNASPSKASGTPA